MVLNTTIDKDASEPSWILIYPQGEIPANPHPSTNNALPGLEVSNMTIARLGENGGFSIFNYQGTLNLVLDVVGYMVPLSEVDGVGGTANTILNGDGLPPSDLGHDGDYYIDNSTTTLYGPKADGEWPTPPTSLVGPAGAAGQVGAVGAIGATGSVGEVGPAGPAGPAGPQGDIGPAGATGEVGPAGPTGAPGSGTVFLAGAQSANGTTNLGGVVGRSALLPLSGFVATASAADSLDLSNLAPNLRVGQPLPKATTVDSITMSGAITLPMVLIGSTINHSHVVRGQRSHGTDVRCQTAYRT
ncbi:MAG: hypothetical protein ABIR12_06130, partial [Ilumatobacteraceae bacterium]